MADMVTVKLQGFDQFSKKLADLPRKARGPIIRPAMKAGTEVVKERVISNAPVKSGALKAAIGIRALKPRKGRIGYRVGFVGAAAKVLVKISKAGKRYFYPSAVEYGSRRAPAHPFMRPAFDATKVQSLNVISKSIAAGVTAALKQ